ncbi:ATP-binding protein [Maricaulis sp.]|uniref:ATP-binding protein n=1 Tax=Maricaulis sp. TaxID=1486257 RepID=UPI003A9549A7
MGDLAILWKRLDRMIGVDADTGFDHTIRYRVALAFTTIMVATALINVAVLVASGEGRPGMAALGLTSGLVFAAIGLVGLKLRRPNLTIALVLAASALTLLGAIWGNRGGFPPAMIYLPGIALGVYIAWGGRAAAAAGTIAVLLLALVVFASQRLTGTPLEVLAPELVAVLSIVTGFATLWVVFLGSTFRSAMHTANADLETANDRLQSALRAAQAANHSKSEFLAMMSHEIRTPLNGVLGMTRVMQGDGQLTERQAHSLAVINESGENLLELLNDILDLSKIEADAIAIEEIELDIVALAASVTRHWQLQSEAKGLSLSFADHDIACPALLGDPLRIRQILNNLLGNAVKFTSSGQITVELSQAAPDADGCIETMLAVVDSGDGIAADKLASIFNAFSQADSSTTRKFGGTGLGLAICRKLADRMGGRISVESETGIGSRFTFALRSRPGKGTLHAEAAEVVPPLRPGRPVSILAVDDVRTNQLVLAAMLGQSVLGEDIRIDCASSGVEAIAAASVTRYDVILMDIQMPEMDGYGALRRLRENPATAGVPVMAVTALTSGPDRRKLAEAGFCDYLCKPFEVSSLREALARQLMPVEVVPVEAGPGQRLASGGR